MTIKYRRDNREKECFYCGVPGHIQAIHMHHVFKRSTHPELKYEETNLCPLCWKCHRKTEEDNDFFILIQELWTSYQSRIKHQDN